jgi:RNA polymerase primary sigma factor
MNSPAEVVNTEVDPRHSGDGSGYLESCLGSEGTAGIRYIHNVSEEDIDDPVQAYLREVCTIPPLTIDEETELSHHLLAHDDQTESAGRRLIEGNLVLVVTIAKRHQSAGIHVLDLIQKGNDGLLFALNTFADASSGTFLAYAAQCIEDAISKAITESRLTRE